MLRLPTLRSCLLVVGLSLAASLGCASNPPPGYLGARVLDAEQYSTYAWLEHQASAEPATDERAQRRQALDARIRELVDQELQARGYRPSEAATATLLVDYHTAAAGEANFAADAPPETYVVYERGGVVAPPSTGRELSHGGLIVDLIDAETKRLLWRGWSSTRLDQLEGEPELVAERADALIRAVLELLPTSV